MANWTAAGVIDQYEFYYEDAANTIPSRVNLHISIEYDRESVSTTQVAIRFRATICDGTVNGNTYGSDVLYVLFDVYEVANKRAIYKFVKGTGGMYYAEGGDTPIFLTKAPTDTHFFLPYSWVCNVGQGAVNKDNMTVTYGTGKYDFYTLFDAGHRAGYACKPTGVAQHGYDISIRPGETVATQGGKPKIEVKDKGNNKFYFSYTLGVSGTNNELKSATIYYTTDGTDLSAGGLIPYIDLTAASGAIKETDPIEIAGACTIQAQIECEFEYNTTSASATKDILFYKAPSAPGTPGLANSESRLTVKKPWTFTWTAATPYNDNSPVAGYYIMLLRKAKDEADFKYVCRPVDDGDNKLGIDKDEQNDTNYYLRRESTSCTAIIEDPKSFGFKPGDEVKLRVKSFAWNGATPKQALQYPPAGDPGKDSEAYLVQNAGVVNVKVGNKWKEGQVYVKVGDKWKEAESISTKVGDSWKESQ